MRCIFILLLFSIFYNISFSQELEIPAVISNPGNTIITQKTDFPVNYYTGQAQVSIPLIEIGVNDVKLDVSLNYDGSGIRTENHPDWVGQNWNLIAGGVITRSTTQPDEENHIFHLDYYNQKIAYFTALDIDNGTWLTQDNTDIYNELIQVAFDRRLMIDFKPIDTEPDIFYFNFLGMSGKFFFDNEKKWRVSSSENIKIELDVYDLDSYQDPFIEFIPGNFSNKRYVKVLKGFVLIDEKGYRYTFGFDPDAIGYSYPFFRQYSGTPFFDYPNWTASSWHLTKIHDYANNLVAEFNYSRSFFTAALFENFVVAKEECRGFNGNWNLGQAYADNSAVGTLFSSVYLDSLELNNGQKAIFKHSPASQKPLTWTGVYSLATQRIFTAICGNPNGGCGLPAYPFLQSDGYYSYDYLAALDNPIEGLKWRKLDSIFVFNNFDKIQKVIAFEYNNIVSERLNLSSIDILGKDYLSNNSPERLTYEFVYNDFHDLPGYDQNKSDHFGYFNGIQEYYDISQFWTQGFQVVFNGFLQNYYASREPNLTNLLKGQLYEIAFPHGGRTVFEYEIHDYSKILSTDRQTFINETGNISGLRIKSITNFDHVNQGPSSKRQFFYENNGISSGIMALRPTYIWENWLSPTEFYPSGGYRETKWINTTMVPLGNMFDTHIGYTDVKEVNLDGSYKIHSSISNIEIKDDLPYSNLNINFSPYARFSDKSQYRGKPKLIRFFNNNNELVKTEEFFYSYNFNLYGISVNAGFGYGCVESNDDRYFKGNAIKIFYGKQLLDSLKTTYHYPVGSTSITEINNYIFPVLGDYNHVFLMSKSLKNSDGKIFMDYYKYPFNHIPVDINQQTFMNQLTNAHRLKPVYSEKKVNGIVVDGFEQQFANYGGIPMVSAIKRLERTWDANNNLLINEDIIKYFDDYNMEFLQPLQMNEQGWIDITKTLNPRGFILTENFGTHSKSIIYNQDDLPYQVTEIDGLHSLFTYDHYSRISAQTEMPKNVIHQKKYFTSHTPGSRSYNKIKSFYPITSDSDIDSVVHITYLDGLGRPVQNVHKYGAPDANYDVITKTQYDNIGRVFKQFEPISVINNHGNYFSGTFSNEFTQNLYFSDPLNRLQQTTPPVWQSTSYSYSTNQTVLTSPSGIIYPAYSLMIQSMSDPDGKISEIYQDKIGRTVLTIQKQGSESSLTWTEYDDKNRPSKIFPPGSVFSPTNLIFEFRYDGSDNMIFKKVPDSGAEEYRYNERNLQTAIRNPLLSTQNKWLVTHYDEYGRPVKRGFHHGTDPGTADLPVINTLLEEHFYDGFNGTTTNNNPIYKGKLKKSKIKILDDIAVNNTWIEHEYFYDIYGRVSTQTVKNHLGGNESYMFSYDFADNIRSQTHNISGPNGVNEVKKYTYDHQGRKIFSRLNLNSTGEKTISQCNYNHKNLIIEKNLGRFATTGSHQYLQSIDYSYNAQSWLTSVNTLFDGILPCCYDPCEGIGTQFELNEDNLTDTDQADLFGMRINYNTALPNSGIPASQNGNISSVEWRFAGQYNQTYSYKYDFLNRLTEARHGQTIQNSHSLQNHYNEKFEYDLRGNLTHLKRIGMVRQNHLDPNCFQPATIDSLFYFYTPGTNKYIQIIDQVPCPDVITLPAVIDRDAHYAANQIIYVDNTKVDCLTDLKLTTGDDLIIKDSLNIFMNCGTPAFVHAHLGPCPPDKYSEGFNQQSISDPYLYDSAGNLIYDPNKKLTLYYNHLNLPYKISGDQQDEVLMQYGADGTLLQRKYIKNNAEVSKTDYLRGKELNNGLMESVYHEDGRAIKTSTGWLYEYWLKDHLGNTRVTFADSNNDGLLTGQERRSRTDYYSFGMEWYNAQTLSDTISPVNRYRYNGKEFLKDLDMKLLDYGARWYDPVVGRFLSVDPLAELGASKTPYHFTSNNPINRIDPDGKNDDPIHDRTTGEFLGHYNDSDFNGEILLMDKLVYHALTKGEDVVISTKLAEQNGQYLKDYIANDFNLDSKTDRSFLSNVFTNLIDEAHSEGIIDYNSTQLSMGKFKIDNSWSIANYVKGSKGDEIFISIHPVSLNEYKSGKFGRGTQSLWFLHHAGDAINILGVHEPLHRLYPGNENHKIIDPIVKKNRAFNLTSGEYKKHLTFRKY